MIGVEGIEQPMAELGTPGPPWRRRWLWIGIGLVVVLVAAIALVVLRDDGAPDPGTAGPGAARRTMTAEVGVFRGTDPAEVAAYETWLGRDVDLVVDFSPRQTWADISSPDE